MEKTKILILATAVAILVAAVAGTVYAQTISTQAPSASTGIYGQASQWGNSATGLFGSRCPWLNGNSAGANTQSSYSTPSRFGTGYGMMGR